MCSAALFSVVYPHPVSVWCLGGGGGLGCVGD
jgi:hypothetical protein